MNDLYTLDYDIYKKRYRLDATLTSIIEKQSNVYILDLIDHSPLMNSILHFIHYEQFI